ncbi:NAD(P)-dependent dehydrogenase (short-subunit alcohol dehydrogenase family) [Breoghania corrubedonensis]|uniref:NAD(P)-dependent dehydrogenase (Short-subunit alcohol dehydrogenase family) n=1 Tax=Breoghania corrubedonensis TaxID=665038 RepID=A0A2T5UNW8_9HYPH|nr:SDR family oxidoreductase [Breoghania corrubedonensis]PTW53210.1 NAD(P)-dependent dehydrogenase (short-subunit alcohol dehydrogenase family) [Breoghania corrubedonensis]
MRQRRQGAALVTGAAKRIGRTLALDLARDGWSVAIHANTSRAEAETLAKEVRSAGGKAHVLIADLRETECLPGLVSEAVRALGPLRLLVNNASIFERDEIGTLDPARFDDHFAVHVRAPCLLAQAMASALDESMTGNIVNVIDQRVLKPTPNFFSYQLSKSALWTATRTLAQALAPRIRVNAIGPGPALASPRQQQTDFEAQCATLPLGHGPMLEEFGRAIRFLVDTPSITGQMITLDGGQHIAWQTPDVAGIVE